MTTHVFVGPSLAIDRVESIYPSARIHPPISDGALYRLDLRQGDTVVIIDGYFYQTVPIRHQEILDALNSGVRVIGAASMGALRAAELQHLGMKGVGVVFRLYASGVLESDDEVAVAHGSDDHSSEVRVEALVNLRATLSVMKRRGVLSPAQVDLVLKHSAKLPYFKRSIAEIAMALAEDGTLAGLSRQVFAAEYEASKRDLKSEDACRALRFARRAEGSALKPAAWSPTVYSVEWRTTFARDSMGRPLDSVVAYAQANAIDLPEYVYRCNVALMAGLFRGASVVDLTLSGSFDALWRLLGQAGQSPLVLDDSIIRDAAQWVEESGRVTDRMIRESLPASVTYNRNEHRLRAASRYFTFRPGYRWRLFLGECLMRESSYGLLVEHAESAVAFMDDIHTRDPRYSRGRISSVKIEQWFMAHWADMKSSGKSVTRANELRSERFFSSRTDVSERMRSIYPYLRVFQPKPVEIRRGSELSGR